MNTAITKHETDAPVAFGSRGEIEALARRIQVMLPSAQLADWQLKKTGAELAAIQKNLNDSLYRAAQLCAFYRLVPGEDVHLIPFGNAWAVDMGIETWKKAADRYCSLHGITYHLHVVEMPADELAARQGENYTPEDVGAIAYLWRSDKAQVYEIFGAEQAMTKGYGVWSKKARYDKFKKEWQPDNIPVQRSKMDVAERRAMKMALKREFSLDSLLAATPDQVRDNTELLETKARFVEREQAISVRPQLTDDDRKMDAMLFDDEPPAPAADEIEEGDYRQPEMVDNPWDDEPSPDDDERQPETRGDTIKPATLRQLHKLGREVYGEGWDAKRAKLVKSVSTGAATSSNELLESEAQKLIAGMKKKQTELEPA